MLGDHLADAGRDHAIVDTDPGVVVTAGKLAVDEHDRLAGFLDRGHRTRQQFQRADVHDQAVDATGQQVLDVARYLGGVTAAVGDHGLVAALGALGLERAHHGDEIRRTHLQRHDADRGVALRCLLRDGAACEHDRAGNAGDPG